MSVMERNKIIYVLGRGRSGSTFIEHAIAQRCGVVQLGEVRLWPKCYVEDHLCSCGSPKINCVFWQPVVDGLEELEATRRAFQTTMKRSFLISLLLPKVVNEQMFRGVSQQLKVFYRKINTMHDRDIILDSSKNPAYGAALAQVEGLDVMFVHVIRHPLGVVYSWKRQRKKKSDAALYNTSKNLAVAALEWTGSNLMCEIAKLRSPLNSILLRYEELTDPALQESLFGQIDDLKGNTHYEPLTHTMSGNPGSDSWKSADFKLDDEWRTGLSIFEKIVYGALTYPLYIFYMMRKGKR